MPGFASSQSFSDITLFDQPTFSLNTADSVIRVCAARIDASFFFTLQAAPELGRAIDTTDVQPGTTVFSSSATLSGNPHSISAPTSSLSRFSSMRSHTASSASCPKPSNTLTQAISPTATPAFTTRRSGFPSLARPSKLPIAKAGFLYNVHPIDPLTVIAVPILLLLVTIAACAIPSWRAAEVDPIQALRSTSSNAIVIRFQSFSRAGTGCPFIARLLVR